MSLALHCLVVPRLMSGAPRVQLFGGPDLGSYGARGDRLDVVVTRGLGNHEATDVALFTEVRP